MATVLFVARHFRKKPVEVLAIRFTGENADEIVAFCGATGVAASARHGKVEISTLEGYITASPGDWIIRGVAGECYPCKPTIFDATYEPVTSRPSCTCPPLSRTEVEALVVSGGPVHLDTCPVAGVL